MKKTLITLLALAGVATAETLTFLPSLNAGCTHVSEEPRPSGITGDTELIAKSTISAAAVKAYMTSTVGSALLEEGWHWGLANMDNDNASDFVKDSDTGFTFRGRAAYGGEFVLATVDVGSLLKNESNVYVDSITLSFDVTEKNSLYFSAWTWDSTTQEAKSLIALQANPAEYEGTIENISLTSKDKVLFIFGSDSGGKINTIANIQSSYTTATIPEPATATLSLLALAGLAARRRRH